MIESSELIMARSYQLVIREIYLISQNFERFLYLSLFSFIRNSIKCAILITYIWKKKSFGISLPFYTKEKNDFQKCVVSQSWLYFDRERTTLKYSFFGKTNERCFDILYRKQKLNSISCISKRMPSTPPSYLRREFFLAHYE